VLKDQHLPSLLRYAIASLLFVLTPASADQRLRPGAMAVTAIGEHVHGDHHHRHSDNTNDTEK